MPVEEESNPKESPDTQSTEFLTAQIIVFCRVCGLEHMPLDTLAVAQRVLQEVCEKAKSDFPDDVYAVHSSVYGRFLACRTPAPALAIAKQILHQAASKGVELSIGVAHEGRVERFSDFGMRPNLIGIPINTAARLAFVERDWNFICVESSVATAAEMQREDLAGKLGEELEGKVKRTTLRYRRLQTPAPSLGELQKSNLNVPDIPVAVAIYDIVGYSDKTLDDAMDLVNRLREEVGKALDQIGGKQLIREGKLWYSPAGDGGVIVFRKEFADHAWNFAVALVEQCQKESIEIRLAAAHGEAVLIAGDLPVGSTIVRTDKICGHPESWQICVEKSFWHLLTDDVRKAWDAKSVDGDSEALILKPKRIGQSGAGAEEPAKDDSAGMFTANLKHAEQFLKRNEKLRAALEGWLREANEFKAIDGGLIEMFLAVDIDVFLLEIIDILDANNDFRDGKALRELLDHLMPMGLNCSWLEARRVELDRGARTVDVPESVADFEAEIIKAGLIADQQIQKRRIRGRTIFEASRATGQHRIEDSQWVEQRGAARTGQPSEFTRALMRKYDVKIDQPGAMKQLREKLLAFWNLGEPAYTLTDKLGPGDVSEHYRDFLLILRPGSSTEEIGVTQTTGVYLQRILELLNERT